MLPSYTAVKYVFYINPKHAYRAVQPLVPFDAIIVPGVPYQDETVSRILMGRIQWAVHLYKSGFTKKIIFSGSAVYTPFYEAKIMKLYAMAYGVPAEDILTDTVAEHSTENLYYSYKLAQKNGLHHLALATDPYQSIMLKRFGYDRDLEVSSVPIIFKMLDTMKVPEVKIDPATAKVGEGFVPIGQRENFLTRFWGTLGMKIREEVYD